MCSGQSKVIKKSFLRFLDFRNFFQKVPQKRSKYTNFLFYIINFPSVSKHLKLYFSIFWTIDFFSISRKLFGGNKISDYIIEDWPNINRKSSWENWFWVPKTFWKFLFLRIYPQDSDLYKGLRYTCSGGLNLYAEGG